MLYKMHFFVYNNHNAYYSKEILYGNLGKQQEIFP